jgi:hypothetical protein
VVGLSGLALAVEAAEARHLLPDSDPSGLPSSALIRALDPAALTRRSSMKRITRLADAIGAALRMTAVAFASSGRTTTQFKASYRTPI